MPHMFPINKRPELFHDCRAKTDDPNTHYISYRMVILYGIVNELKQASASGQSSITDITDKLKTDLRNMDAYLETVDNPNNFFAVKRSHRGMLFDLHEIGPGILLNDHNDCTYPLILHKGQSGRHRLSAFLGALSDIRKNFPEYFGIINEYLDSTSLNRSDAYKLLQELNEKISELSIKKIPTRPGT